MLTMATLGDGVLDFEEQLGEAVAADRRGKKTSWMINNDSGNE